MLIYTSVLTLLIFVLLILQILHITKIQQKKLMSLTKKIKDYYFAEKDS